MFRFRMSGQTFEFDSTQDFTAAELFAVADIVGISDDEDAAAALTRLAADVDSGHLTIKGAKALLCLAWLAHQRAGGTLEWAPFTRTVVPATLELLDDGTGSGDGGPQRKSSTRQRPKGRKK